MKNIMDMVQTDSEEEIRNYLTKKPNLINLTGYGDDSLLIVALERKREGVAKLLIELGVNVNHKNYDGYSALTKAAFYSSIELFKTIFDLTKNPLEHKMVLEDAIIGGKVKNLEYAVSKGFNIHQMDKDGSNMLHLSIDANQVEVTKYILKNYSIDINERDSTGNTAVMLALYSGKEYFDAVMSYKPALLNVNKHGKNVFDLSLEFKTDKAYKYFLPYLSQMTNDELSLYEEKKIEFILING